MVKKARTSAMVHDVTSRLPDECIGHIFRFIPDSTDRSSCAAVSKRWLHLQATMRRSDFSHGQDQEELSRCLDNASDTTLAALLVGASSRGVLTRLTLAGGVSDSGLKLVAQACPGLKSLNLWHCAQIGNDGLAAVAGGCRLLENLHLFNSRLAGERGLAAVAAHCRNLSTLTLESCPSVGNRSIAAFANAESPLKSVTIERCPLVGEASLVPLISSLPELARLKLAWMKVSDAVLEAIGGRASKLSSLILEIIWGPSEMGYSWIGAGGAAVELESISLQSCVGLTARSFGGENRFAGLKKVTIRSCASLSDEGLVVLTESAHQLQILALQSFAGLSYTGLVQSLLNCKATLKGLSLVGCNLTGETPPLVHYAAELDAIELVKCQGVSGSWFLSWLGGACKRVKHVTVSDMGGGNGITDAGVLALLRPFEGGKAIESLELSGCTGIGDGSFVAVARACGQTLRSLRLRGCVGLTNGCLGMIGEMCPGLKELDLSWCGIRDGGVLRLSRVAPPELRALSLAGCERITDRSLEFLEQMCCSSLVDMLNVSWCSKLTQRGIESTRSMLFWCDITA